jgi:hypothetical protein
METESGNTVTFIDVSVYRKETSLHTRHRTEVGACALIHSFSPCQKRHCLYFDEWSECYLQGEVRFHQKLTKIGQDLALNGYPQHLVYAFLNRSGMNSLPGTGGHNTIDGCFWCEMYFGKQTSDVMETDIMSGECSKPCALSRFHLRELYLVRALRA